MLLNSNTCSSNSRVYKAATEIGHDKTLCTLTIDSPCSMYGTPLTFLSQTHTATHTNTHSDLHHKQSKTFPHQQCPSKKNTDKGQSYVFSTTSNIPENKSGMLSGIICNLYSCKIMPSLVYVLECSQLNHHCH